MAKNTVIVSILGDTRDLQKKLGGATSSLGKWAKGAAAAAAVATAAVVGAAAKGIRSASRLQQNLGAMGSVFKGSGAQMERWATQAAGAVGLAKSEYAGLATVLGAQLKNMGVAQQQLGTQTNSLITLGADLAAQFGGSTADAVGALSSLLRGERDPIERYGVSINEAAIKAKLAEMGLASLTGEAAKNAKLQATLALLTQQTADAQGAFSRESTTLAGAQQRLAAGTENLFATFGTALLPAITAVTAAAGTLINRIQGSDWFASMTASITGASNAFADFVFGIINGQSKLDFGALFDRLLPAVIAGIQNAAAWISGGGLAALLSSLTAGRAALLDGAVQLFGAIAAALPQIIPALVQGLATFVLTLVQQLATFVPQLLAAGVQIVQQLIAGIAATLPAVITTLAALLPELVGSLLGMLPSILSAAVSLFSSLIEALPVILPKLIASIVGLLPTLVMTILTLVPQLLVAAVQLFTSLITSIPLILPKLLIEIVAMLPQIVRSIVSMLPALIQAGIQLFTALITAIPTIAKKLIPALIALGPQLVDAVKRMIPQLLSAGVDLMRGLMDGITSMGQAVLDTIGGIVGGAIDWAKQLLGIHSPSRVFRSIGAFVGAGFVRGLRGSEAAVKDAAASMIDKIKKGMDAGEISKKAGAAVVTAIRTTTGQIKAALAQRDRVLDKLATAKDKLSQLVEDRADFVAGVKSSVVKLGDVSGFTAVKDMVSNLRDQVAAAAKFRSTLDKLGKMGLDATTRDQLLQGFLQDGSTATADALLAGGPAAVKEVANLQRELGKQGSALGNNVGDKMYQAGIDSARGLVRGLESQAAALDRTAGKLADALVGRIKKKLGIRSPSRVLAGVGAWTVKGFVRGVQQTERLAVRSMAGLSDAVTGVFVPQLAGPELQLQAAGSAGSSGGPSRVYEITVHAVSSAAETGRAIVDAIRAYEAAVAVPVTTGGAVIE